jgi:hypothetical protein
MIVYFHVFLIFPAVCSYVPLAISQHSFGDEFGPLYQDAREMALETMQQK